MTNYTVADPDSLSTRFAAVVVGPFTRGSMTKRLTRELEALAPAVEHVIERRLVAELVVQQVLETVGAVITLAVVAEREPAVEIRVVTKAVCDELLVPRVLAEDLPGGEWRRIQKASGYHAVFVNGEGIITDDTQTGAHPGSLLRHGHA